MDKTELGLTIATGVLSLFLNSGNAKTNDTSKNELRPGYIYVEEGLSVMISEQSTKNVKAVTVKYDKYKSNIIYSHEHISCTNNQHRVMKIDLYNGKQFIKSEVIDFPKWEFNNSIENMVHNVVCR